MFADDEYPETPRPRSEPPADPPQSPPEEEEEDFASMLEQSLEPATHREGQMVEGRIVSIGNDVAFIDVGGKGEASIDVEELADPDGEIDVRVGDVVQAIVVSTSGGLKLSHKLARGAASRERLGDAYRAGLPVEGRVEKTIKGGYEVRVAGQRAFCPISQIDKAYTEDAEAHVGQVTTFKIIEYKDDGKDLVVSRRALIEEEEQEQAAAVRETIVAQADLRGRVASVRPYGAFVDLGGGIQGLLHVSEMGWSRVSDPATIVQPGDEITVRVLRVDWDNDKISLGLKQLQADPWSSAADTYEVGQLLMGRVTRLADFGAFIELEPGIEALAHVSTFPPSGKRDGWKDSVQVSSTVAIEVLSFDSERKRIGVAVDSERSSRARDDAGATAEERVHVVEGARLTGKVERHEKYGMFVFLAPGKTGLVPMSETGVERESDLARSFPVGSEIEVMVLEIEPGGRRIRLSRKALLEAAEKDEARAYAETQDREQAESFGSLADKLRNAMRPKDP